MKAKRSVAAKRFLVLFGVSAKKNTLRTLQRYEVRKYRGKPFYLPRRKTLNSAFIGIAVIVFASYNNMV